MEFYGLKPVQTYCPNCGHKCVGFKSRDDTVKIVCERCGVKMVSKHKTKRVTDIRMTAPRGACLLE